MSKRPSHTNRLSKTRIRSVDKIGREEFRICSSPRLRAAISGEQIENGVGIAKIVAPARPRRRSKTKPIPE